MFFSTPSIRDFYILMGYPTTGGLFVDVSNLFQEANNQLPCGPLSGGINQKNLMGYPTSKCQCQIHQAFLSFFFQIKTWASIKSKTMGFLWCFFPPIGSKKRPDITFIRTTLKKEYEKSYLYHWPKINHDSCIRKVYQIPWILLVILTWLQMSSSLLPRRWSSFEKNRRVGSLGVL